MISPALATLAGAVVQVAANASEAALRGAQGAFELLLRDDPETQEAAESAPADSSPPDSAAALEKRANDLLEAFREQATARLQAAGISLEAPLVLEADRLGGVRVASGHPQAAAIERIFSEEPELVRMFEAWQDARRAADRQRQAETFERLYALDPTAAQSRQSDSTWLDEQPLRVTLGGSSANAPNDRPSN